VLVAKDVLDVGDLEQALFEKERSGRQLGEVLVDLGMITTRELAEALTQQYGLEFLDLSTAGIDGKAATLLPEGIARRYRALPVGFDHGFLVVAVGDPTNLIAHDDLRLALGTDVRIVIADGAELDEAIAATYRLPLDTIERAEGSGEDAGMYSIRTGAGEGPAITLVNDVIGRALAQRASDIHFEPQVDRLVVRLRVDGVTQELTTIASSLQQAVIARLKVMGGLDIAQRRVPQDGRISVQAAGQRLDMRIALLPTVFGEQAVIRILHGSFKARLDMAELGMSLETEMLVRRAVARPHGAILACGPTGSGKTTTLYAALDLLNEPGRVIVTIEDPVEYQLAGAAQIEIDSIAGLTFARGLRTILRSDPDVILVGEIRDEETARIAMQAAMTGHLVLTTLHAQSASSAIARLRDMGVDVGLLAPSINCVLAQRLARRLCQHCREPHTPGADERRRFGLEQHEPSDLLLFRAGGCKECQHTGYQGRVAMYEAMPVDGKVRPLLGRPSEEISAAAIEQGMTTLHESGVALCLAGISSLEEVERVIGEPLPLP
jgi:type IV pilus assembly protein PilB